MRNLFFLVFLLFDLLAFGQDNIYENHNSILKKIEAEYNEMLEQEEREYYASRSNQLNSTNSNCPTCARKATTDGRYTMDPAFERQLAADKVALAAIANKHFLVYEQRKEQERLRFIAEQKERERLAEIERKKELERLARVEEERKTCFQKFEIQMMNNRNYPYRESQLFREVRNYYQYQYDYWTNLMQQCSDYYPSDHRFSRRSCQYMIEKFKKGLDNISKYGDPEPGIAVTDRNGNSWITVRTGDGSTTKKVPYR